MRRVYNNIILTLVLLVIWLPFIQCQFHFPHIKGAYLMGIKYHTVEQPHFSLSSFMRGGFQDTLDTHSKERIGYRDYLTRIANQLDYEVFGLLKANIVRGKDGYLYQTDYIDHATGKDCLGEDDWKAKVSRLKVLQDTLAVRGVTLLYCIAPGKASFAMDNLPAKYSAELRPLNNYRLMSGQLNATGCNMIDFHSWFDHVKLGSKERLFPSIGTHWSVYGASLALDSMIHYMALHKGVATRKYQHTSGPRVKPYKWLDTDLRDMANLLFEFDADSVSYPVYTYDNADTVNCFKPRIIVVSDSYFTAMQFSTDLYQIFDRRSRIWDYNHEEFDLHGVSTQRAINPADIDHCDFLIIMNTEKNYDKFDYGLINSYYSGRQTR